MQATFSIKDAMIAEWQQEAATTRRLLERVPSAKLAWKPHQKSMSLGHLATHLAVVPGFVSTIIKQDGFNFTGAEDAPPSLESTAKILELFDANTATARATIAEQDDARLMAPWTLSKKGQTLFTVPRLGAIRLLLLSHSIHHRGQLSVYLRLQDVPLPSIYGPSADTPM